MKLVLHVEDLSPYDHASGKLTLVICNNPDPRVAHFISWRNDLKQTGLPTELKAYRFPSTTKSVQEFLISEPIEEPFLPYPSTPSKSLSLCGPLTQPEAFNQPAVEDMFHLDHPATPTTSGRIYNVPIPDQTLTNEQAHDYSLWLDSYEDHLFSGHSGSAIPTPLPPSSLPPPVAAQILDSLPQSDFNSVDDSTGPQQVNSLDLLGSATDLPASAPTQEVPIDSKSPSPCTIGFIEKRLIKVGRPLKPIHYQHQQDAIGDYHQYAQTVTTQKCYEEEASHMLNITSFNGHGGVQESLVVSKTFPHFKLVDAPKTVTGETLLFQAPQKYGQINEFPLSEEMQSMMDAQTNLWAPITSYSQNPLQRKALPSLHPSQSPSQHSQVNPSVPSPIAVSSHYSIAINSDDSPPPSPSPPTQSSAQGPLRYKPGLNPLKSATTVSNSLPAVTESQCLEPDSGHARWPL
ncbi:hypothetical protein PQX77_002526 [Marasmius sp. AFHP31]|nr:hypothetical protein PQX77_002526 [Marasmius sp. AFHP31]